LKAGLLLQRYTAWNAEIYEIYYGVSQDGIIRGITADGRNLFLPEKWSSSGRYLHQEDLGYLTFTHTLSPRTFYEIRIARSRTLQDTIGVHPWSGEPRRDRDDWFNTGRQVAMWVASERERHILKADLSSQVSGGHMVRAGFEIVRYNSWYTYWGGRSKQDNAFTFYAGGDRPWEMGNPASPIRGALYVQDKMEFEGLVVNAGLRVDLQKHTHRELIQPGFVWAPMWRVYAHRQFGYGVGTAEGAALRNDFAQTPPTAIHVSPRVGVSHPVGGRCALHFSLGRFIQWADLSSMYAESYSNLPRMGTGGSTTWWDANGNGVEDPAERLNLMQPAYAGLSGNPWARPEETLTFEIGVDWSFVADYVGSLTVYYRSETQQHHPDGVHWLALIRHKSRCVFERVHGS
jgi:hypothetical protein